MRTYLTVFLLCLSTACANAVPEDALEPESGAEETKRLHVRLPVDVLAQAAEADAAAQALAAEPFMTCGRSQPTRLCALRAWARLNGELEPGQCTSERRGLEWTCDDRNIQPWYVDEHELAHSMILGPDGGVEAYVTHPRIGPMGVYVFTSDDVTVLASMVVQPRGRVIVTQVAP